MATDNQAQDARFAAELSPDIDAEKVGSVYAEALFGALDNDLSKAHEVLDELDGFLREAFDATPGFESVLTSRLVPVEEKLGILERVFSSRVSPTLYNFLRTVVRRERSDCLRAIYTEAMKIYDRQSGRVPVTIFTATPLDASVLEGIRQGLSQKISGDLVISCQVNPEQIGGLVVRIGDTIYDGSIASQLAGIRQRILEKYVPTTTET